MDNIKRAANLMRTVISSMEVVTSIFSWEKKPLSAVSFLVRSILLLTHCTLCAPFLLPSVAVHLLHTVW